MLLIKESVLNKSKESEQCCHITQTGLKTQPLNCKAKGKLAMIPAEDSSVLWIVVVGFILAFVVAFGIGANDVANTFGTSVGARVLTLKQACIVASVFELLGAILIGARVSDTVRKGIIDISSFNGTETLAMAGAFSALGGTSAWLLIATFFRLPVSATHSVVGATIGYGLVAHGADGIKWKKFGLIAASWVISPVLSGLVSCILFVFIQKYILNRRNPLKHGLRALPFFYGVTIMVNFFSIFIDAANTIGKGKLNLYMVTGISVGSGVLTLVSVAIFLVPWEKKRILRQDVEVDETTFHEISISETEICMQDLKEAKEYQATAITVEETKEEKENGDMQIKEKEEKDADPSAIIPSTPSVNRRTDEMGLIENKCSIFKFGLSREDKKSKEEKIALKQEARDKIADDVHSAKLFRSLQVMTACFGAFAHGGNDVSNAIGPLISLWITYKTGLIFAQAGTPIWILFYGGVGIVVGLSVWGRRVIKTIGENLTPITPSSGFAIEIGAAFTVLMASNLGIPVSTTHCKVGSVVFVGHVRSKDVVDWSLFVNIVISWIVTVPITGYLVTPRRPR